MSAASNLLASERSQPGRSRLFRHKRIAFTRIRGLTMVELMVALTIALIILAAMSQLFSTSRSAYTLEEGTARLQESGRFAFDLLAEDIRHSGYFGCLSPDPNPTIVGQNAASTAITAIYDKRVRPGVQGYRYVGSGTANVASDWTPSLNGEGYWPASHPAPRPYSDVLVIRYATSPGIHVLNATETAGPLDISSTYSNSYTTGDILMVSNCKVWDIFVATGISTAGATTTIAHDTPQNLSANLNNPYRLGAELMQYHTLVYYVADTGRTDRTGRPIPALFRKTLGSNIASPDALVSQELIEGVEVLRFYFGVIDGPKSEATPVRYVPANQVADWSRVTAVRFGAVVGAIENIGQSGDNIANIDVFGLTGVGETLDDYDPPNDTRPRRVFGAVTLKRQPPRGE